MLTKKSQLNALFKKRMITILRALLGLVIVVVLTVSTVIAMAFRKIVNASDNQ